MSDVINISLLPWTFPSECLALWKRYPSNLKLCLGMRYVSEMSLYDDFSIKLGDCVASIC